MEVKTGTIISYSAVRRGIQKLRDKYAEEGYFLAEVSYDQLPQRDNQVLVKFKIKEHERVTVRRVTFIGNTSVPDSELREVMITRLAPVSEQMILSFIAEKVLDLPRSY